MEKPEKKGMRTGRTGRREAPREGFSEGSVLISVILILELLILLALSTLSLQKPESLKLLVYRDDPGMVFTLESLLLQGESAMRAGLMTEQEFFYESDQVSGTMTMSAPVSAGSAQTGGTAGIACTVAITLRGDYLTKCYTGEIGIDAEGNYWDDLLLRMSET